MNYELAKKLKDAGFPQNFKSKTVVLSNGKLEQVLPDKYKIYSPSLSELIEACMDFYFPCSFNMGGKNTWWAIMRDEKNTNALVPIQTGTTPEEAVANLWLKLNKK